MRRQPSCTDLRWINHTVHEQTIQILDRVADATGDDPETVAVSVGSNLLMQAAAMIAVASGVPELGVEMGRRLNKLVTEILEEEEMNQ